MDIKVSDGMRDVTLHGAGLPIGITTTATTERDMGRSSVRFVLYGTDAIGEDPYKTLSEWQWEDNRNLALHIGNHDPIDKCSLRECSLDLQQSRLYVEVYTPFPAQEVRHWFDDSRT